MIAYNQSGTAVDSTTNFWSANNVDNLPGVYYDRLDSTQLMKDGLTTSVEYTYDSTNGLPETQKDIVGVNTGASTFQDKETDLTYAYQNNSGMQSANMLSQVSEVQTYSVSDGVPVPNYSGNNFNTTQLVSETKTLYSTSAPYYSVSTEVDTDGLGHFLTTDSVISRDSYGNVTESENVDGIPTTTKYGFNGTLPIA